jgi:polyhydroxyalkanoate synthesis repressor PhaR
VITIKKYPNRRLYDTTISQYINLDAVKDLVMTHKEFEVVDSKTGENLTKSILLQIITEQEANDQQSVLTQTVLKQLIRFYGSDSQLFMRQYLERSIAMFLDQQDGVQSAMSDFIGANSPLAAMNKMVEANLSFWRNFTGMENRAKPNQTPSSGTDPQEQNE